MSKQEQQSLSASTSLKQSSRLSGPSSGPDPSQSPATQALNNRLHSILAQIRGKLEEGLASDGIDKLLDLTHKIRFLKENDKIFDPRLEIVCYYNLGCGYQMQAFQKANEDAIDNCIASLTHAINLTQLLTNSTGQLSSSGGQFHLKLKLFNAKMLLQCCALLSQLEKHQLALEYGKQALSIITNIFKGALKQAKSELEEMASRKRHFHRGSGEALVFAQSLVVAAIRQLHDLQLVENFQEVMSINTAKFDKIKENSYFWKDNFQNNCQTFKKQMRKVIENSSRSQSPLKPGSSAYYSSKPLDSRPTTNSGSIRNYLGMKISSCWVSQLNIGKIMRMTPIDYVYFIEPDNIAYQFSSRSLVEKVIMVCVIYFSIATQMRFLEDIANPKQIVPSYQQSRKSEMFHFRSIQVGYKYIKEDCPLIDHLITSYLRHYHSSLASIEEKPSFVEHSEVFGEVKRSTLILSGHQNWGETQRQGDYMILDLREEQQACTRQTLGSKNNRKINLLDSAELQRPNLVKSLQWTKNPIVSPKDKVSLIEKSLSSSSRLKLLKKSSASTRPKDSITLKQAKQYEHRVIPKRSKSKRSNNKCSKRSIIKAMSGQK